jgi:hypothetical protein
MNGDEFAINGPVVGAGVAVGVDVGAVVGVDVGAVVGVAVGVEDGVGVGVELGVAVGPAEGVGDDVVVVTLIVSVADCPPTPSTRNVQLPAAIGSTINVVRLNTLPWINPIPAIFAHVVFDGSRLKSSPLLFACVTATVCALLWPIAVNVKVDGESLTLPGITAIESVALTPLLVAIVNVQLPPATGVTVNVVPLPAAIVAIPAHVVVDAVKPPKYPACVAVTVCALLAPLAANTIADGESTTGVTVYSGTPSFCPHAEAPMLSTKKATDQYSQHFMTVVFFWRDL